MKQWAKFPYLTKSQRDQNDVSNLIFELLFADFKEEWKIW